MVVLQDSVYRVCRPNRVTGINGAPSMIIRPEPLTRETFRSFGDVLETEGIDPQLINFGNTQKFGSLAKITTSNPGSVQLSIYRSSAIVLPFRIQLMECHPLGSQAFYPLHQRPFPVVVARAGSAPGAADIRVFQSNGHQGVNLYAGVWHHYQLTLGQESDYLVVDRGGQDDNYREHQLTEDVWLDI